MLPTKPRSGLSETSNNKTVPTSPNVSKTGRARSTKFDAGTPPLQKSRSTPRSVESKPTVERRSPKISNGTSDKHMRAHKGSEVQEDLKKAKEQLALVEQEKNRVLEELRDAKKSSDEANEKLKEALAAQKNAEENSDIEKLRADEFERVGTEACREREDRLNEIENMKKKHSLDDEALISMKHELEKVKNELELTTKARSAAVTEAEDVKKIARIKTEKVEHLSEEIRRLKSLLDSKLGGVKSDEVQVIKKLNTEIDSLRYELEVAKESEERLFIMESLIEKLSNEADNAKSAELDSLKLVDEWKKKAESLEVALMEAKESEMSSIESLASVRKQLEDTNASLQDAESETAVLKGKVESLEIEVADVSKQELDLSTQLDEWKKKAEFFEAQLAESSQLHVSSSDSLASVAKQLEESQSSLEEALAENSALRMKIESLETEIARSKEDLMYSRQEAEENYLKIEGLKSEILKLEGRLHELNQNHATSDAESFSEERSKLLKDLEIARLEEEKAKKAMEGLTSALHEVSVEARETQEKLLAKRVEQEDAYAQIEQLRSALKNTQENYEIMLDEARYEIVCLKKAIENFATDATVSQAESVSSDLNCVGEIDGQKEELATADVEQSKVETFRLKKILSEEEDELPTAISEDRTGNPEGNGELSDSEKDYDLLPSSKEIPIGSINGSKEKNPNSVEELEPKEANGNGNEYSGEEEPVEIEVKMLEGYKTTEKASPDNTNEGKSVDDELELKMSNGSFDHTNGISSETTEDGAVSLIKQQQHQKKKKPFLGKFGNLLKKKNHNN